MTFLEFQQQNCGGCTSDGESTIIFKSVRKVKTKMTFWSVRLQFNPISQHFKYAVYSHQVRSIPR